MNRKFKWKPLGMWTQKILLEIFNKMNESYANSMIIKNLTVMCITNCKYTENTK